MRLEEHHFFPGGLGQAQPVCDLLLAPAPHDHVALLEAVCEILHHVHDHFFGALVHQVWLGQDPCEKVKEGQREGQRPPRRA